MKNLFQDERGAVMTEFVIALPVFVIIFVGIVNLNKVEQASVRMKLIAATNTWNAATQIHGTSDMTEINHGIPQLAAANAAGIVAGDNDNLLANVDQFNSNAGLGSNGSEGEMENGAQNASQWAAPGSVPGSSFDYAAIWSPTKRSNPLSAVDEILLSPIQLRPRVHHDSYPPRRNGDSIRIGAR